MPHKRVLTSPFLGVPAALQALSKSIELFDKEPRPFMTRGAIYLEIGDLAQAVADFGTVLELSDYYNSDYYRQCAHFMRADCYVRLKDFAKARADCAKVEDGFRLWTDRLRSKEEILAECHSGVAHP